MTRSQILNRSLWNMRTAFRALKAVHLESAPWDVELVPFTINVPIDEVPPWLRLEDVEAAIRVRVRFRSSGFGPGRIQRGP